MAKSAQAVEEKPAQQENSTVQAQSVELSEASGPEATGSGTSLDILLDTNIPVTVAIGQTETPIRRLLQLGPGSVIKLNKPVDQPVDLYLRDARFATGDIVVVDNQFAVRIKQILGQKTENTTENNNE